MTDKINPLMAAIQISTTTVRPSPGLPGLNAAAPLAERVEGKRVQEIVTGSPGSSRPLSQITVTAETPPIASAVSLAVSTVPTHTSPPLVKDDHKESKPKLPSMRGTIPMRVKGDRKSQYLFDFRRLKVAVDLYLKNPECCEEIANDLLSGPENEWEINSKIINHSDRLKKYATALQELRQKKFALKDLRSEAAMMAFKHNLIQEVWLIWLYDPQSPDLLKLEQRDERIKQKNKTIC